MLTLTAAFGDDEHTAVDGPYVRMLRLRKWVIASSALLTMLITGWFNLDALATLIPLFEFPRKAVYSVTAFATVYYFGQYILLSLQFLSTYDIILDARFKDNQEAEYEDARRKISALETERQSLIDSHRFGPLDYAEMVKEAHSIRSRQSRIHNPITRMRLFGDAPSDSEGAKADLAGEQQRLAELESLISQKDEAVRKINIISSQISTMQEYYVALHARQPISRFLYRDSEIAIDIIRLVVPVLVPIIAIGTLVRSALGI